MNKVGPKQPRLRLGTDSYRQLHRQVLERDGWRCQACGTVKSLQVHHIQLRSHSGTDIEENLITLCHRCHRLVHCGLTHRSSRIRHGTAQEQTAVLPDWTLLPVSCNRGAKYGIG